MTETRPADRRCYILSVNGLQTESSFPLCCTPKISDSSSQLLILLQLNSYDTFMREVAEELYLSCKSCVSTNNLIFENVTFHGKLLLFPSQVACSKSQKNYKINRFDRNLNRKPHSKSPMDPPNSPSHLHFIQLFKAHFSPEQSIRFKCTRSFSCSKPFIILAITWSNLSAQTYHRHLQQTSRSPLRQAGPALSHVWSTYVTWGSLASHCPLLTDLGCPRHVLKFTFCETQV